MVIRRRQQNGVRYDPEVLKALRRSAVKAGRTLTEEVNLRLRESFGVDPAPLPGELSRWAERMTTTLVWLAHELNISWSQLAAYDRGEWGENAEETRANVMATLKEIEMERNGVELKPAAETQRHRIPRAFADAVWRLAEANTPTQILLAFDAIASVQSFKVGDKAYIYAGDDFLTRGPLMTVVGVSRSMVTLKRGAEPPLTVDAEQVLRAEWVQA